MINKLIFVITGNTVNHLTTVFVISQHFVYYQHHYEVEKYFAPYINF